MADLEAGRYDVALVAGVEVLRNVPGQKAGELLGCAAWAGREAVDEAFPWPHMFSKVAQEYKDRYGLSHDVLEHIVRTNFANAQRNPNAQTRTWNIDPDSFGIDDELNPVIDGDLRKFDCGRITDGSAAVILASQRYARDYARERGLDVLSLPRIKGWGHATAPMLLSDKLNHRSR